MSSSEFDPTEAVTFDLAYGHIHLDGAPTRVMVPAETLVTLCRAAGSEVAAATGHTLGEAMGRRAAVRLGGSADNRHQAARKSSFEAVISEMAGELALTGFGALSAERWGKALVLVVDQSPLGAEGDELLAAILKSALVALVDRPVVVIKLQRDDVRARFVAVSESAAADVRARLDRGDSWGDVLAALHQGGGRG